MPRPEPTPEAGAHLLDYVRVLLKRIWLILGIFVTVVAVVLFATYRATPMFRATAVINIRQPNQIMGRLDPSELIRSVSNSEVYMNTRYALLASRSTAEKMVTKHRLQDWPEFRGVKEQQIVRAISGNVEVEPRRSTSLVRVSVVNANPTLAMKLANKLVETFKYLQEGEAASDVEDKIDKVESKWLSFQQKGSLEQGGLRTLMQENNTDLETFLENYEYKRDRLRRKKELIDQHKERQATDRPFYERILEVRKAGNGHDEGLASLFNHPSLRKDEMIRSTEQELAVLQAELTHLMRDLGQGEKFEAVADLRRRIAEGKAILEHEKKMFLLGYVASYEELTQVIEALEEQLEEIEAEFRLLSALKREYDEKMDRIARYKTEEDRYFALLEKLQDARTDKYHPVTIAQTASEPIAPFKPDRQLNLILGVVFGLLGGLGVAFFLEYLDDTIKTKEELERITRTQLFGVIPHMPVRKRSDVSSRDLFVYAEPKSTIAEAFRGIRTALAYSSQKGENQVYLVTSAGPKEGKSTIAINLATVMAFDDTKTVLVDADLRRPRVHRSFGLQNDRGLSNLIIGDSSIEDVVQPTGLENLGNLSVLPSGPIPPNPSELLGRDRVTEILLQLRERYDRVLIDSPPVGAVTDAVVLGRIVDTVILVVHAGRTRKKLVERGLEQLGQVEVDVAGVVLNNLKISRKRYYPGYYHYYYYYSSYYGAEEKPVSRRPDKESTGA